MSDTVKSFDYDKLKLSVFELAKDGGTDLAMEFLDLIMHAQKLEEKVASRGSVGRPRGTRKKADLSAQVDSIDANDDDE